MNYPSFAFKGPKDATNLVFLVDIVTELLRSWKSWVVVFLTLNISKKLRISVINSSQWNISLVSIFWVIWGKVIQTREVPDFLGGEEGVTQKYEYRVSFKNLFVKQYEKISLYLFFKEKSQPVDPKPKWSLLFRSLLKIFVKRKYGRQARRNRKTGVLFAIVDLLPIKNDSDKHCVTNISDFTRLSCYLREHFMLFWRLSK